MKKAFFVVAALIFLSAPAFARDGYDRGSHHRDGMGRRGPGHIDHMSAMVGRLIKGAESLELTDGQMNRLEDIQQKHLFAIIRENAELYIAKIKVKDTVHKPAFNPKALKERIRAMAEIKQRIAELSVDAMAAVRSTIGMDNYELLVENMPGLRGPMDGRGPHTPEGKPMEKPKSLYR